jgi:hypothetical protein
MYTYIYIYISVHTYVPVYVYILVWRTTFILVANRIRTITSYRVIKNTTFNLEFKLLVSVSYKEIVIFFQACVCVCVCVCLFVCVYVYVCLCVCVL